MEKLNTKTALFLCMLILAISGLHATSRKEVPYYEDRVGYSVENGKATIIEYNGSDKYLIIPEKVGGYEVTSIDAWASWEGGFTAMEIPNSVILINEGNFNFGRWDSLTEIILRKDHPVYSFSEGALFDKTKNMLHTYLVANTKTSYVIPDFVTNIVELAFYKCRNLKTVVIPDSVTSIGRSAFYECSSVTTITIPNSVTSIGNSAFGDCKSLAKIEIPNSLTSIGTEVFWGCESLTAIEIPSSVTSIGRSAFAFCTNLVEIQIPNSVTSIEERAFGDCTSLVSIHIPNSVTSIGQRAFGDCTNLTEIILSKNHPVYRFSEGVLFDKKQKMLHSYLDSNKKSSYTIPDSVTSIGEEAFYECKSLTRVEIPNSVTSIGWRAFSHCESLTKLEIPNSVTSIDGQAFSNCMGLTVLEIPDSVTSIGARAFSACKNLTTLKIPDSVTSIDKTTFENCPNLTLSIASENSYAREYALENEIDFIVE